MPGCIVSATTASFRSVEKRRRRATPVITSTFENVSDIGVCLGLCLGPPAKAGVRSKQGALHAGTSPSSANRGLNELRKRGLLKLRKEGAFNIKDRAKQSREWEITIFWVAGSRP